KIHGANLPVAILGVMLLWFGWFGFNGGSTLAMNHQVPYIIANTLLAGAAGMVAALGLGYLIWRRADVVLLMNGSLAGLVAITANCHAVTPISAIIIGAIGSVVMLAVDHLLERLQIDDAVGAIPVHLGAGIWGTLAVALFGETDLLAMGVDRWAQFKIQLLGVFVCFLWSFGATYFMLKLIHRLSSLRVMSEDEHIGLNVSEHGASTELQDLFTAMDRQSKTRDLSLRVPVEPFTEVGQIAERYNLVMDALEREVVRTEAIVRTAREGIITISKEGLLITTLNPAAESMFGYSEAQVRSQSISLLLGLSKDEPDVSEPQQISQIIREIAASRTFREMIGRQADGSVFPLELMVSETRLVMESFYTVTFRDITERKRLEELEKKRVKLETEIAERKRAEEVLQESEMRFRSVTQSAHDAIISADSSGKIISWNKGAHNAFGYEEEEVLGKPLTVLMPERYRQAHQRGLERVTSKGESLVIGKTVELHGLRKDGTEFPLELSIATWEIGKETFYSGIIRDITQRKQAEEALAEQAIRDTLTNLYNRRYFNHRIQEEIARAKRNKQRLAILLCDLDHFKAINDLQGHQVGDEVLKVVAKAI
ncbi:MAG: PAS domain S-box protein, partial [Nitrososphaera sp.]|nr:PAS domain S-box protein [Nitrososphaera sp.]